MSQVRGRRIMLATLAIDAFLVAAPVVLGQLTSVDVASLVPGFVFLLLAANLWAARELILQDIDNRIPLASLRRLARQADTELFAFIDLLTTELVSKVERLGKGELVLRGNQEYWRFVIQAFREAKCSVLALDVNTDLEMLWNWESRRLQEYYAVNKALAASGFVVSRVFVFRERDVVSKGGRVNERMLNILRRQHSDGINVAVAWLEDLQAMEPRVSVNRDYLVFEGNKVIHASTPQAEPYYDEAVVTKDATALRRFTSLHQAILKRAMPFDEFLAAHKLEP